MKKLLNMPQKIKQLLSLTNQTPNQLAKYLSLNHTSVGYWLREGKLPSTEYIPAIAEFFGVSIEYLYNEHIPQSITEIPFLNTNDSDFKKAPCAVSNDAVSATDKNTQIPIAGYVVPVEFSNVNDIYTKELLNVFISLEPKGQHLVLAEAYNQALLQKANTIKEKETC